MNTREFQINELTLILNEHFQWSKPRMACFVGMLVAIMIASTVNLTQLALFFPSQALISSRYRRIQRFFHHHRLDYNEVAKFIMKLFGFMDTDYYLSLDRTNWKWGKANVNLLVLAVVYRGAAIPVYWLPLNKRGNSNTRERIALMKRFISQFGQHRIKGVLADREFIGDKWLGWMLEQNIPFYVRIRNNSYRVKGKNKRIRVDHLFRTLKPGEVMQCSKARYLGTCSVYLSGLRLSDGKLLILASHHSNVESIKIYGLRWEIETLFGCLKGRGFKLEDTRMVGYLRIKKLLVLPVIAFCWSHKVGDWKHDCVLPIKIKTHQRLAQSIFRYGLDCLRSELFNGFAQSKKMMKQLINLLCQTPSSTVTNGMSATCWFFVMYRELLYTGDTVSYTIYLSGEIHSDWREQIIQGIQDNNLDIEVLTPITDHDRSDNVGEQILGSENNNFWKDHKAAKINALRTQSYMGRSDIVIVRFGDKYKQWNAAFDAGTAYGMGIPVITMHSPELTHPLKEVDAAALAVTETPKQVVEILQYISQ